MKLLFFSYGLDDQAGWHHLALETARGMLARGHEIRLIVPTNATLPADLEPFALPELIPFLGGENKPFWRPRHPLQILKHIRWADLVHVLVEPLTILASLLVGKSKPLIYSGVGTYSIEPLSRWWAKGLFRRAWKKASQVVAISDYTRRRIEQHHGPLPQTVVPLGVRPSLSALAAVPTFRPDPQILGVGAVKRRKDFVTAVRAFSLLLQQFPGARYRVVGSTKNELETGRLKKIIGELGLEGRVELLGFQSAENLERLYRESQLFLMTPLSFPWHFEGFGLVYLEANSYGLPTVGTRESGAEEAIRDGFSGRLVAPENPEATALAMREILHDETTWARWSQNARAHAQAMTWDRYGEKLEEVYRSVLAAARPDVSSQR